jgi:hypothetical protein
MPPLFILIFGLGSRGQEGVEWQKEVVVIMTF